MKAYTILIIFGMVLFSNPVRGEPVQSANVAVCAPSFTVATSVSMSAGDINFCIYYPPIVASASSTVQIISILTAPAATTPTFNTAASAFTVNSGCTEGTPILGVPTTNGVVGTTANFATKFTMTSEECDALASMVFSIGAAQQIYSIALPITIETENRRVDNFNYLCNAPSIAPNAYSTTGTTCIDPNIALTGDLGICPPANPCYHNVTGSLNSSINIMGNVSLNQTNLPPTPQDTPLNSLWLLLTVFGLVVARLAQLRGKSHYSIFAGLLQWLAALMVVWEWQMLGFDNISDSITMILAVLILQFSLGLYMMWPKDNEKENPA